MKKFCLLFALLLPGCQTLGSDLTTYGFSSMATQGAIRTCDGNSCAIKTNIASIVGGGIGSVFGLLY